MKHHIFVLGLLLTVTFSFTLGQQLDSLKVTSWYVGGLYTGSVNSNWKNSTDASIRAGGDMIAPLIAGIDLEARAGYDFSPSAKTVFGKFYISKNVEEIAIVSLGFNVPRPITMLFRLAPITAGGHFEPPSLAAMPGGGTGFRLSQKLENLSVIVGGYHLNSNRLMEMNIGLELKTEYGTVKFAGFSSDIRKGIAVGYENKNLTLRYFAADDSITTVFCEYKTKLCDPFITGNFDKVTHSFDHLEFGWTKTLQGPNGVKALVGMGWQYHTKLTNLYVQIFI